jgi:hypothetical protein
MSGITTSFQLRDILLIALDHLLQKHDFKRSKHEFVWKKKIDKEHTYQIHLNFGTYSDSLLINPVPKHLMRVSKEFSEKQVLSPPPLPIPGQQ